MPAVVVRTRCSPSASRLLRAERSLALRLVGDRRRVNGSIDKRIPAPCRRRSIHVDAIATYRLGGERAPSGGAGAVDVAAGRR